MAQEIRIFVDADACPVKEEAVRVAMRHDLDIHFVANSWMRLPEYERLHRTVVADNPDAADDWIADRVTARDCVITQDIPLAARCLKAGAKVIGNSGKPFNEASIGMALAMRDLNQHLRETGDMRGGAKAFTRADRSQFLRELENAIQALKRSS